MHCYLFSSPPQPFPSALVDLVRQLLQGKTEPLVAYLPAGNIQRHFVREVKTTLRPVAEVSAIKPEIHPLNRIHQILERADLLFIPGGNTYLMAQRLHQAGIVPDLRRRILEGLPLVAFSAGTVFCGQNILTTNDINCCGCTQFDGLKLVPFNFNVHYPSTPGEAQQERDERLEEFQFFHDLSVLALEDGAYAHLTERGVQVCGPALEFNAGSKTRCQAQDFKTYILAQ